MKTTRNPEAATSHFSKRAKRYDASSSWVCDQRLIAKIFALARPGKKSVVLDLALGTGRIARAFKGRVGAVIGVDACPEMTVNFRRNADCLVMARGENMPFPDNSFDICTCRQGLQFMDLDKTLAEVRRVLRPGGRVVFCHLTSYGGTDDKTSFLVQRLRNPARKNFFSPGDMARALVKHFSGVKSQEYITRESVKTWIDNGAIPAAARARIMRSYSEAPGAFKAVHKLVFRNGDILDSMRLELVTAVK